MRLFRVHPILLKILEDLTAARRARTWIRTIGFYVASPPLQIEAYAFLGEP